MKNILYIHGLHSLGITGRKLEQMFPQYNWFLPAFNLVNPEETIHRIVQIIKKEHIDTLVSSSLGGIYSLYIKKMRDSNAPMVNKILINPCLFPSKHLSVFPDAPKEAKQFCIALEYNIAHHHKNNLPEHLFGVFAKNDELFQYRNTFAKKYGAETKDNYMWIEGGHSQIEESELKRAIEAAAVYFDRVSAKTQKPSAITKSSNLADPSKPFYNTNPDRKPILYFDMDGVLVDFKSGVDKVDPIVRLRNNGDWDEIPGLFRKMDPMPGAVEAFHLLAKHFDVFILSTSPWDNASACNDKLAWVKKYLGGEKGAPAYKRLIFSHHKDLNKGDFLIDDRPTKNGAAHFEGKVIPFGSAQFPDWDSVIKYLLPEKN